MGIYVNDLRELVIRPTLLALDIWSPTAENLLLGTAAQESDLGFRMQSDKDCGLGIYFISARAHTQVWDKYLVTDPELASRVRGLASQQQFLKNPHSELVINLSYATAIAWMIYKRQQIVLTDNPSAHELARYWLHYYCARDEQAVQKPHNDDSQIESFVTRYRALVLHENKILAA
jgi:hypothetical protein